MIVRILVNLAVGVASDGRGMHCPKHLLEALHGKGFVLCCISGSACKADIFIKGHDRSRWKLEAAGSVKAVAAAHNVLTVNLMCAFSLEHITIDVIDLLNIRSCAID